MAFWNTWKLFAIGIAALVVLSLIFALLLSNLGKYNPRLVFVFLSVLLLPIVVPSSVTGLFIQEVFGSTGIVNGLITAKGAAPVNFLNSPLFVLGAADPVYLEEYRNCKSSVLCKNQYDFQRGYRGCENRWSQYNAAGLQNPYTAAALRFPFRVCNRDLGSFQDVA